MSEGYENQTVSFSNVQLDEGQQNGNLQSPYANPYWSTLSTEYPGCSNLISSGIGMVYPQDSVHAPEPITYVLASDFSQPSEPVMYAPEPITYVPASDFSQPSESVIYAPQPITYVPASDFSQPSESVIYAPQPITYVQASDFSQPPEPVMYAPEPITYVPASDFSQPPEPVMYAPEPITYVPASDFSQPPEPVMYAPQPITYVQASHYSQSVPNLADLPVLEPANSTFIYDPTVAFLEAYLFSEGSDVSMDLLRVKIHRVLKSESKTLIDALASDHFCVSRVSLIARYLLENLNITVTKDIQYARELACSVLITKNNKIIDALARCFVEVPDTNIKLSFSEWYILSSGNVGKTEHVERVYQAIKTLLMVQSANMHQHSESWRIFSSKQKISALQWFVKIARESNCPVKAKDLESVYVMHGYRSLTLRTLAEGSDDDCLIVSAQPDQSADNKKPLLIFNNLDRLLISLFSAYKFSVSLRGIERSHFENKLKKLYEENPGLHSVLPRSIADKIQDFFSLFFHEKELKHSGSIPILLQIVSTHNCRLTGALVLIPFKHFNINFSDWFLCEALGASKEYVKQILRLKNQVLINHLLSSGDLNFVHSFVTSDLNLHSSNSIFEVKKRIELLLDASNEKIYQQVLDCRLDVQGYGHFELLKWYLFISGCPSEAQGVKNIQLALKRCRDTESVLIEFVLFNLGIKKPHLYGDDWQALGWWSVSSSSTQGLFSRQSRRVLEDIDSTDHVQFPSNKRARRLED
jgi:hypothetical protein